MSRKSRVHYPGAVYHVSAISKMLARRKEGVEVNIKKLRGMSRFQA